MLFDIIRLVMRDLYRRKFSSFLTLFAISLGILTIFVIFLISAGFESSIQTQFEKIGSNRLYLTSVTTGLASTSFTKGITDSDVKYIESRPYVLDVFPYYMNALELESGNEFAKTNVMGTTLGQDFLDANSADIESGRVPKESEKYSMVVGSLVPEDLFEGTTLNVGSNIYIKGVKFKVVGILKSFGSPPDDMSIFVNIDTLRDVLDKGDAVGFADIIVDPGYDINIAADNLKVSMENRLGEDSVDVRSPLELIEQVSSILDIVKFTLGGIGAVALLVGSLGIVNTMYVVVSEKRREIGIMKAVGARNFDILFMFVFHAGLFGMLGGFLGVMMGGGASILFEFMAQSSGFTFLEIGFNWVAAISLFLFSFFIGAVSGFIPARNAANTNIIDAIRK